MSCQHLWIQYRFQQPCQTRTSRTIHAGTLMFAMKSTVKSWEMKARVHQSVTASLKPHLVEHQIQTRHLASYLTLHLMSVTYAMSPSSLVMVQQRHRGNQHFVI